MTRKLVAVLAKEQRSHLAIAEHLIADALL